MRRAGQWLGDHPERDLIAGRYLRHDKRLVRDALTRLDDEDSPDDPDEIGVARDAEEEAVEKPISLNEQRITSVLKALTDSGANSVVDLGCGEGTLIRRILKDTAIDRIVGVDVSHRALERAARRLHLDTMAPRQRQRVELVQGALTYRDRRLKSFDAATVVEVIEHLDPPRLGAFERALFAFAEPRTVIVTTPNIEVEGELRELRCHYGNRLFRVLYRRSDQLFVLLHVFEKRSRAVPEADKAIARARWEDFRARMNAQPRMRPRAAGHDAP